MDKLEKQAEQLFEEGTALYEQEKPQAAEEKFEQALKLTPKAEEIRYNLALAQFEQGKYEASYQNAARIFSLDCTELLEALDAAGYKPQVEIPDEIPDHCELCAHFATASSIRDAGGFCQFYETFVPGKARCLVWQMAEEGTVDAAEIEARHEAAQAALRQKFEEVLKDDWLPELVECTACGSETGLSDSERQLKRFTCKSCKKEIDVQAASTKLDGEIQKLSDAELLEIILSEDAFRIEYLYAAKRELRNRSLNILDFPEMLPLLARRASETSGDTDAE